MNIRVDKGTTNNSSKKTKIFMILFAIIFLVIGAVLFYRGYSTKDKGVKLNATITRIDVETTYRNGEREKDYDVYIDYTYNEEKFTNISYPVYSSGMKEGKQIEVTINPSNPTEFYTSTSDMFLGGGFMLFAIIFIIIIAKVKTSDSDTLTDSNDYYN